LASGKSGDHGLPLSTAAFILARNRGNIYNKIYHYANIMREGLLSFRDAGMPPSSMRAYVEDMLNELADMADRLNDLDLGVPQGLLHGRR
jgi:hypothetical protein